MKSKVNLFVVGWPKCGTSIIWEYLKEHPLIYLPRNKDLSFFSNDSEVNSIKDYEAKFYGESLNSNEFKYYLDSSTNYISSNVAAKNIYKYNPKAKIIIMVREPIDLMFSFYAHAKRSGTIDDLSFENWIKLEKNKKRFSDFYKKINNYLKYFDSNSIIILEFNTFKKENQEIMNIVFKRLKLNTYKIKRKTVNQNKSPRSERVLIISHFLRRKIKFLTIKLFSYSLRLRIGTYLEKILFSSKKQKLSPKLRLKLMKQYELEVIKLNDLLYKNKLVDKNMDLVKLWGYENL